MNKLADSYIMCISHSIVTDNNEKSMRKEIIIPGLDKEIS